jgi:TonB family protein
MKLSTTALILLLISSSALAQVPWPLPKSSFGGARALNGRDWYKVSDYPDASASAGEQGYVTIAFDIGVNGRMSNCTVIRSSGYKRLDEIPCKILPRRARFAPATDANGTPIATKGTTSMSFWTPD